MTIEIKHTWSIVISFVLGAMSMGVFAYGSPIKAVSALIMPLLGGR